MGAIPLHCYPSLCGDPRSMGPATSRYVALDFEWGSLIISVGILVHSRWDSDSVSCIITYTENKCLATSFIYTMGLDLAILLLTLWKLMGPSRFAASWAHILFCWCFVHRRSEFGPSRLSVLLSRDGLLYFAIAFLANLVASVSIPDELMSHADGANLFFSCSCS